MAAERIVTRANVTLFLLSQGRAENIVENVPNVEAMYGEILD